MCQVCRGTAPATQENRCPLRRVGCGRTRSLRKTGNRRRSLGDRRSLRLRIGRRPTLSSGARSSNRIPRIASPAPCVRVAAACPASSFEDLGRWPVCLLAESVSGGQLLTLWRGGRRLSEYSAASRAVAAANQDGSYSWEPPSEVGRKQPKGCSTAPLACHVKVGVAASVSRPHRAAAPTYVRP